jgi:nucleotide-binding universal stress UspA family protein
MRVLLAIDGSASSEAARRVVASLNWPDGTMIEVVGVVEPLTEAIIAAGIPLPVEADARTSIAGRALERTLQSAANDLDAPGRGVRPVLLEGRPASVIVDRAEKFRAELVIVGSRGLGPLKSLVLGSVSAEVVDHAGCPVLVVRRPTLGSILVAVDGSPSSRAAVEFLAGTRFLAGRPIEVLSVGPTDSLPTMTPLARVSDSAFEATTANRRAHREQTEGTAASAAQTLLNEGCLARWTISVGDPAHEIIEAARSFESDLIVLGSRGRIGLTRMVLGSVARKVLLHTDSSVLIVHEPVRQKASKPVEEISVRRAVPSIEVQTP